MRMEKEDLTQIKLEWKPSISLYGCGGTKSVFRVLWQKGRMSASGKCVNQKTFLLQSIFSWEQNEKDCSSNLLSPSRENAHFFLLGVAWVGYWGTPSVPWFLLSGGGGAHYSREAEEEEAMPSMNSKFVFLPLLLCMQKSSNLQFVTLRRIKAMVGMCRHPARSSIRPEHSWGHGVSAPAFNEERRGEAKKKRLLSWPEGRERRMEGDTSRLTLNLVITLPPRPPSSPIYR